MRHQAIERLLPAAFQRAASPGSVLAAVIEVMEAMHAPDEAVLEHLDDLFTPHRTTDPLIRFLARWVALDHLLSAHHPDGESRLPIPIGRMRNLIADGAALARCRGTPDGLRRTLEIATGVTGFVIDEPADRPFHVVVRVPAAAADQQALVRQVVATEKPAATTAQVVVEPPQPTDDIEYVR
jgi:phage tail-like protein